jgi:hypothetical protein
MRASYTASDRVHSTLQKAVKDGNVLEKIKAFEMQAAAAQAELTPKLGGGVSSSINNRMQSATSSIQLVAHRTLSPAMVHPIQHPISPMPIQHESQQQHIRSHRSRHVHPVQPRRDGNLGPITGRESRKGAHVLEPARGDIILKRRTPSQKTVNDEDYSMTAISSMTLTASPGHHHHHRQHHQHHRASASRSRHRQEVIHDKRSSSHYDPAHKKHQQKPKETTTSTSNKTSTRRRWLKGRKETSTENGKQDVSATKSDKNNKNKKKNSEKEKLQSTKKVISLNSKKKSSPTSDNNRVYGVPTTTINVQTKTEAISPEPPSRIEEENESDREEKTLEDKSNQIPLKEEEEEEEIEMIQGKECDTIVTTNIERRPSKTKYHQKLSSGDGEILSKIEDDTRFVLYKKSSFSLKIFILFLDFLVLLMIMHIVLILMMMMMNVKVKKMFLLKNLL